MRLASSEAANRLMVNPRFIRVHRSEIELLLRSEVFIRNFS